MESKVPQIVDILGEFTWEEVFEAMKAVLLTHIDACTDAEIKPHLERAWQHISNADEEIYMISK